MPNCQSDGRTPQPCSTAGSMIVSPAVLPNPVDDHGPHSPFAAGFINAQSATKLWFASFHVRLTVVWKFGPMRPLGQPLRRSARSFSAALVDHGAEALQLLIAVIAVVSMPASVLVLVEVYAGHATVAVRQGRPLAPEAFLAPDVLRRWDSWCAGRPARQPAA